MTIGINDIKKVNVTFDFGSQQVANVNSFSITTFGEAGTSIAVRPADGGALYNRHYGAGGQALFSKSYKPKNYELEINVLRFSEDYYKMQALVQQEISGNTVVFKCTYEDNNTKEKYYSEVAVLAQVPDVESGPDVNPDCTYLIVMRDVVMTAPSND